MEAATLSRTSRGPGRERGRCIGDHDSTLNAPGVRLPGASVNHLNNAGASLMPEPVLRAVIDRLELEAKFGGYEAAARQEDAWQHTYDALATLINCHRDEVAVVENATRAWDMAF
jgi:selenocysteine lyase/cysteine desulfurase